MLIQDFTVKKVNPFLVDFVFIVLLAALLLMLSEWGHVDIIAKYPFVFLLVAYFTGKFAAYITHRQTKS